MIKRSYRWEQHEIRTEIEGMKRRRSGENLFLGVGARGVTVIEPEGERRFYLGTEFNEQFVKERKNARVEVGRETFFTEC